jgi:hypothetical protein
MLLPVAAVEGLLVLRGLTVLAGTATACCYAAQLRKLAFRYLRVQ